MPRSDLLRKTHTIVTVWNLNVKVSKGQIRFTTSHKTAMFLTKTTLSANLHRLDRALNYQI